MVNKSGSGSGSEAGLGSVDPSRRKERIRHITAPRTISPFFLPHALFTFFILVNWTRPSHSLTKSSLPLATPRTQDLQLMPLANEQLSSEKVRERRRQAHEFLGILS
ncbi:hypothetical protein AVEN_273394-1 [Araneus ventricosus]|uniref:Uncharacterized protein n=1 Tax=Araneus ventricosus TaxID=182803 RepID=A0A4Y2TRL0_ARAVE|nr:hypothetical protein AVEN_273394-1 [Araneus ventricosus]